MANSHDAVWVSVLPDMSQFHRGMTTGVVDAAKKAGHDYTKGFNEQAKKAGLPGEQLGKDADKTGRQTGSRMGGAVALGLGAATAGIVAVAAGIGVAVGKAISGAMDLTAMDKKLNQQLGIMTSQALTAMSAQREMGMTTGKTWEKANEQILAVTTSLPQAGKMSADELAKVTRAMGAVADVFELDIGHMSQVVGQMLTKGLVKDARQGADLIAAAMQQVPVQVREEIMDAAYEYGPFFASLGYSGEQMFAQLTKAAEQGTYGVDKYGDAVKEFGIRATDMSKTSGAAYERMGLDQQTYSNRLLAGGDTAQKAFGRIVDGLLKIKDPAGRAEAAIALFGTPLEDLSVNDIPTFLRGLKGTAGGLGEVTGRSDQLAESLESGLAAQWGKLTNTINVAVRPAVKILTDQLAGLIGFINDKARPYLLAFRDQIADGEGTIWRLVEAFGRLRAYLATYIMPIFTAVGDLVRRHVAPLLAEIARVVIGIVMPPLLDLWRLFSTKVIPILSALVGYIVRQVLPTLVDFARRHVVPLLKIIGDAFQTAWDYVIHPALKALVWVVENVVGPVFRWLWEKALKPYLEFAGKGVERFANGFRDLMGKLRGYAAKPINFVIGTVWNDGLRVLIGKIPGVTEPGRAPLIPGYAGGGFVTEHGRYTGDGHRFAPAGTTHAGEYVLTKPDVKALGGPLATAGKIGALLSGNLDWRTASPAAAGLQPYWSGGPVRPVPQRSRAGWRGGYYGSGKFHGGIDYGAPVGTPIRSMFDGVVTTSRDMTTSFGRHVKIAHGSDPWNLSTLYAHMLRRTVAEGQRVAAGQIIGLVDSTGNSTGHHLHLEGQPGGRRGPGISIDPERLLAGARTMAGGTIPGFMGPDLDPTPPGWLSGLQGWLDQAKGWWSNSAFAGDWGQMILTAAKSMVSDAWAAVAGKAGEWLSWLTGGAKPGPAAAGSGMTPVTGGTRSKASFYDKGFQGKRTASGELFDTNKMTAAHKSLPFGTVVAVTNPATGKTVQVRINDRGPYIAGRALDLSRAAMNALTGGQAEKQGVLTVDWKTLTLGKGGYKKHRTGTGYAPGGLSLIAEHGPELVTPPGYHHLATGSRVYSAAQTRALLGVSPTRAGATSPTTNVYVDQVLVDADELETALDFIADLVPAQQRGIVYQEQ